MFRLAIIDTMLRAVLYIKWQICKYAYLKSATFSIFLNVNSVY